MASRGPEADCLQRRCRRHRPRYGSPAHAAVGTSPGAPDCPTRRRAAQNLPGTGVPATLIRSRPARRQTCTTDHCARAGPAAPEAGGLATLRGQCDGPPAGLAGYDHSVRSRSGDRRPSGHAAPRLRWLSATPLGPQQNRTFLTASHREVLSTIHLSPPVGTRRSTCRWQVDKADGWGAAPAAHYPAVVLNRHVGTCR